MSSRRKTLLFVAVIILATVVVTGLISFSLKAATCRPYDGSGTCTGECCLTLLGGGCVAGPCDKIFK